MNLRFHLKFLKACDTLLQYRIENKILAKKVDTMLNRLHVAVPQQRDDKERPPYIPGTSVWFFKSCIRVYYSSYQYLLYMISESVLEKRRAENLQTLKRKLEKELEEELGDDYILDLNKNYDLPDEYKYDKIPEFLEGLNIYDFIDPDLFKASLVLIDYSKIKLITSK